MQSTNPFSFIPENIKFPQNEFPVELLKKMKEKDLFTGCQASQEMPTLHIKLKVNETTNVYKLTIKQTHYNSKTQQIDADHKWKHVDTLKNLQNLKRIEHPWHAFLELKYNLASGLDVSCLPQLDTINNFYIPFNYIFDCTTDLKLKHLVTPGYIDVRQAKNIENIFSEAKAGIRLNSHESILNAEDSSGPGQIISEGPIFLLGQKLNNSNSLVSGQEVIGYFDHGSTTGVIESIDNTLGKINSENTLCLYSTSSITNSQGLMQSKSKNIRLSTLGRFDNSRGRVIGFKNCTLFVKDTLYNLLGLISSQTDQLHMDIGGFSNYHGSVTGFGDIDIQSKDTFNNSKGSIDSKTGKLTIRTAGNFVNIAGQITSQGSTTLRSGELKNFGGFIESRAAGIHGTVTGVLDNAFGHIIGKKVVFLDVKGLMKNHKGFCRSEGSVTLNVDTFDDRSPYAGNIFSNPTALKGESIAITAANEINISPHSHIKAQRTVFLNAPKMLLQAALISRHLFIESSKELAITAGQSMETIRIRLQKALFSYKEDQLQASKLLSIHSNADLWFKVPLKVKGALEITANTIYNQTLIAADGPITLKGTSKSAKFPVWNINTIVSNQGGITIDNDGFRHHCGKVECAGDFKFGGRTIQILAPLTIGGDTCLFVPDQNHIDAKKSNLGNFSYIDYAHLSVNGLLRLIFPDSLVTFRHDLKISGKVSLEKNAGYLFSVLYNVMASKGVHFEMPNLHVGMGNKTHKAVKIQSAAGKVSVNAKSLDIEKVELYAKAGINFAVKKRQLHIGRGVEENRPMFTATGWNHHYFNVSTHFPFTSSNGTLLVTEGDFIITSPYGVLIDMAEIILPAEPGKGNMIINTDRPVQRIGDKIHVSGDLCIRAINKIAGVATPILQDLMLQKTARFKIFIKESRCEHHITYPCITPGELRVGNNLFVELFESAGSKTYVAGAMRHPTLKKPVRVLETDHMINVSLFHGFDFWKYCEGGQYPYFKVAAPFQRRCTSSVTLGKDAVLDYSGSKRYLLEGVFQARRMIVHINDATLQVGKIANYQRPADKPFQQTKMFVDVHRPTALFKSSKHGNKPWINEPVVPLSPSLVPFSSQLPRAVVITPEGVRLMRPNEKYFFHFFEEVDALPRVFEAQMNRGCLDWEHTDTVQTYLKGRRDAFNVCRELFGIGDEVQKGNSKELTIPQQFQSFCTAIQKLPPEKRARVKFMILYYQSSYEGRTVFMPVSWISPEYDDPQMRNPDGGIFTEDIAVSGKKGALQNFSTVKGNKRVSLKDVKVKNERTSYHWTEKRVNQYSRSGGFFGGGKEWSEVTDIACSKAQSRTGVFATGPGGMMEIETKVFESVNGAELNAGEGPAHFKIGNLIGSPAIDMAPQTFQGSAGGTSIVKHVGVPTIQPSVFTSLGGFYGTIDNIEIDGTRLIAIQKDIALQLKGGRLGCPVADKQVSLTVTEEDDAVVVEETTTQIAMPCAFLALNGDVKLKIKDKLTGKAPIFYGNVILVDGEVEIESLLLKTVTNRESTVQGLFSSTKSTSRVESPVPVRAIFEAREVQFEGGNAKLGGAFIKAAVRVVDGTPNGIELYPTVEKMYWHQNTEVSSPLAHGEVGGEGWEEVMIAPVVDTPELVRKSHKGKMSLNSVEFPQKTTIKGRRKLKKITLQRWERRWNNQSQVIPQEAKYAIALATAYYTAGAGAAFANSLFSAGSGAAGMANVAVQAGFRAFCVQAVGSLARSGDPLQAWKEVISPQSLKSIAEAMAAAAVLHKIAPSLDHNNQFQKIAASNAVKAAVKICFGAKPQEALKYGARHAAVEMAGAWIAGRVGAEFKAPAVNLAAHAALGGGMAYALGENVASGAAGAAINNLLAHCMIDPATLIQEVQAEGHAPEDQAQAYEHKLQEKFEQIRILSAALVGLAKGDAAIADQMGENALNHNFAEHEGVMPSIGSEFQYDQELFDLNDDEGSDDHSHIISDGSPGPLSNFIATPGFEIVMKGAQKVARFICKSHPAIKKVCKAVIPERLKDKRPVALVLTANVDHNKALDLHLFRRNFYIYKRIERVYNTDYQRISKTHDVCRAIDLSKSKGKTVNLLIIRAHGSPQSMQLDHTEYLGVGDLPRGCLRNLSSKAVIVLHSCSTGQELKHSLNLAEYIALNAPEDAVLFAAKIPINNFKILNDNPFEIKFNRMNQSMVAPIDKEEDITFKSGPFLKVYR